MREYLQNRRLLWFDNLQRMEENVESLWLVITWLKNYRENYGVSYSEVIAERQNSAMS